MKKNILTYVLVFSLLGGSSAFADGVDIKNKISLNKVTTLFKNIKMPTFSFNKNKENKVQLTGLGVSIDDEAQVAETATTEPVEQMEVKVKETTVITQENIDAALEKSPKEKKGFWIFSKKEKKDTNIQEVSNETIEQMKPTEDAAAEVVETHQNDNIWEEKQKAIEDANSTLSGSYFSENKSQTEEIVEGQVQKEEPDVLLSEPNQVEGYIQETVILSLDDCIRKALQNNPQIRSAYSNSEIYKTHIAQAWANYFPTFNMTNGVTRNRFLSVNFAVPQSVYTFYNAVDASASQLLFDFGKTKAAADMSKKTYESTIANLDETINTIIYDVKAAYYSLLHALEKQNVYADSVKSYELQLKQAEAFYLIGTKPKIDVTMAQYNLGNAQLGHVKASNEVTLAIAQLNNAMGLPEEDDYKILDKLVMNEYIYDFDDLLSKAYEARPELLSYRKKAKASELLIRSTKRAFLPNIEGIGAFSAGGGTRFTDDYGWTVGAQFVYGNTNLFLLKKQIDEAKATHEKDLADLDVAQQNVYLQVKQAHINLKNAKESIPITALSLKHAREQYNLASGRYKAGVGDAIELKDSEVTYRNARLDYLAALLQYNVSVADLERVVGFKLQKKEAVEQ